MEITQGCVIIIISWMTHIAIIKDNCFAMVKENGCNV